MLDSALLLPLASLAVLAWIAIQAPGPREGARGDCGLYVSCDTYRCGAK